MPSASKAPSIHTGMLSLLLSCCLGKVFCKRVPDENELLQDPTVCQPSKLPPLQALPMPRGRSIPLHSVCTRAHVPVRMWRSEDNHGCHVSSCLRQSLLCGFPLCIPHSQLASRDSVTTCSSGIMGDSTTVSAFTRALGI